MKQNLLFFMTDQQRADTIAMYQCEQEVTPCLNALINESTHFKRAYNCCPLCVPSRTALATGIEPLESKMFLNTLNCSDAPNIKTLHQTLYDNGYDIAHIGVNHITVSPALNQALPFAAWECDESYAEYAKANNLNIVRRKEETTIVNELCDNSYEQRPYSNTNVSIWPHDTQQFKDLYFAQKAVDFINSPHEKPFALFVCLWAPHPPLCVPKEYLDMFPPEQITLPKGLMCPSEGEPRSRRSGAPAQLAQGISEQAWRRAWSAHCALVHLCDDALLKVIAALKQTSQYNNTTIVYTADHGEHLGQHKMYQKMEMYEAAVRVPAVFRVPNGKAAQFDTPVSHIDFVPTVLDLLHIEHGKYSGVSLAKSITMQTKPQLRDVFSVYCGNHKKGDVRRMVVRDNFKYIFDGEQAELYDLALDEAEQFNIALLPINSSIVTALHKTLQEHFAPFDYIAY